MFLYFNVLLLNSYSPDPFLRPCIKVFLTHLSLPKTKQDVSHCNSPVLESTLTFVPEEKWVQFFPHSITNTWYHRTFGHGEKQCHFILLLGDGCTHKSQNLKTPRPPILCVFSSSRSEVDDDKQHTTSETHQARPPGLSQAEKHVYASTFLILIE